MTDVLVIGYGNELRGDDAVGPLAARAVATWGLPGVRALAVHQLTPELAEPISAAGRVVFVDACVEAKDAEVLALVPGRDQSALVHTSDPGELLALAEAAFGRCPPACVVTVPARAWDLGEGLSLAAALGLERALQIIQEIAAHRR